MRPLLAILACLGVVGAIESESLPVEEAVRVEAEARAMARARLSDPSRPPRYTDCEAAGLQFIAWRDDGELPWRYACVRASFIEETKQ